ncbi:uncharacterized protein N7458_007956 [Penicillium daleae]|uniref:Uncharacterized protein n=1 Tax=Penicillium daleae TaxID=63821 RepID=A0AAD6G0R6_9EURO|nr:uncharacterized protein N7458_007956 [Penicillium daleae]KAJ5444084.1 hypothetical protein N7458_007956 [Penicillium daleae]
MLEMVSGPMVLWKLDIEESLDVVGSWGASPRLTVISEVDAGGVVEPKAHDAEPQARVNDRVSDRVCARGIRLLLAEDAALGLAGLVLDVEEVEIVERLGEVLDNWNLRNVEGSRHCGAEHSLRSLPASRVVLDECHAKLVKNYVRLEDNIVDFDAVDEQLLLPDLERNAGILTQQVDVANKGWEYHVRRQVAEDGTNGFRRVRRKEVCLEGPVVGPVFESQVEFHYAHEKNPLKDKMTPISRGVVIIHHAVLGVGLEKGNNVPKLQLIELAASRAYMQILKFRFRVKLVELELVEPVELADRSRTNLRSSPKDSKLIWGKVEPDDCANEFPEVFDPMAA